MLLALKLVLLLERGSLTNRSLPLDDPKTTA